MDDDTDERFEECAKRIVEEVMNRIQQKPIKQLLLERLEFLVLRKTSTTPGSPSQIDPGILTGSASVQNLSISSSVALIALLRDGSAEGKTQAAAALANVAYHNVDLRVRLGSNGVITLLVTLLRDGSVECKTAAAWGLLNFASHDEENKACIAREGGIEPLIGFLRVGNEAAMWSIVENSNDIQVAYDAVRRLATGD